MSKFNTGDAVVKFFESGAEVCRDEAPVFLDGFWCAKYTKSISTKTLSVAGSTIEGVNGDYAFQNGNWKNSSNCYIINDGLNWKITNGTSIGATVYYQALISSATQNIYGDEMPPFKMGGVSNDEQVTITTRINVPSNIQEANVEMRVYQRVSNVDSLISANNVSFVFKDTDFAGSLRTNGILYANKQLSLNELSGNEFCLAYNTTSEEPLNYQALVQCAISASNASAPPIVAFNSNMSIRCNYLMEVVKYNSNYYYYLYEGVKSPHLHLTFSELLNGEENTLPYNDENTKRDGELVISPEDILSDYKKNAKAQLEKLMNQKEKRLDIVNIVNDRLYAYIVSDNYKFEQSHVKNFQAWILDDNLPMDCKYGLVKRLIHSKSAHTRDFLVGNEKIYELAEIGFESMLQ